MDQRWLVVAAELISWRVVRLHMRNHCVFDQGARLLKAGPPPVVELKGAVNPLKGCARKYQCMFLVEIKDIDSALNRPAHCQPNHSELLKKSSLQIPIEKQWVRQAVLLIHLMLVGLKVLKYS